ncbi:hypothetical protein MRX96_010322 [Rhipicephalus microplus]
MPRLFIPLCQDFKSSLRPPRSLSFREPGFVSGARVDGVDAGRLEGRVRGIPQQSIQCINTARCGIANPSSPSSLRCAARPFCMSDRLLHPERLARFLC